MFLSREIDIKLCQIFMKIHIFTILFRNGRFKQIIFSKYATNRKTSISHRILENLRFPPNIIFQFLINIIDKIISYSPYRPNYQNFSQWQCSILVSWYRRKSPVGYRRFQTDWVFVEYRICLVLQSYTKLYIYI